MRTVELASEISTLIESLSSNRAVEVTLEPGKGLTYHLDRSSVGIRGLIEISPTGLEPASSQLFGSPGMPSSELAEKMELTSTPFIDALEHGRLIVIDDANRLPDDVQSALKTIVDAMNEGREQVSIEVSGAPLTLSVSPESSLLLRSYPK